MESEELNFNTGESLLVNLKKYLNYQISSFLLFALSFFSFILIILLTITAILFIPYVIFVLYKNKKYGWIITLLLITIIPAIILVFVIEQTYTLFIFLLIGLGIFYLYCFTLRLAVNGWVKEINTVKLIDYQRKRFGEKQGYDSKF